MKKSAIRSRSSKGSHVIELASVSLILAVVTIMALDIGVIVFGTVVHNRACREACRAAAQANGHERATKLARGILNAGRNESPYMTTVRFENWELDYNDYGGNPQPDEQPTVTLTTHCDIRIPAGASFCGALLGAPNGVIKSSCNYTFPIMNYQVPIPPSQGP
jgi:hypothetical protein